MPTVRKHPRISVNKLAEYLGASAIKRKAIVKDAKEPMRFKDTRYKEARETIKKYLINRDEDYVLDVIAKLEAKKKFASELLEQDNLLQIEVLELLLESEITVLDKYEIKSFKGANQMIKISGVDVSVNPDLIVQYKENDISYIGGLKIHVSKTAPLSTESQKIVGVMLYNFAELALIDSKTAANSKLCFSFDIFAKTIECCPSSHLLRMKKVEAACEEIALWWDKL